LTCIAGGIVAGFQFSGTLPDTCETRQSMVSDNTISGLCLFRP